MRPKEYILQKNPLWSVYSERTNCIPVLLQNDNLQRGYATLTLKRDLPDSSRGNSKPPIREPNMPDKGNKKQDKKKKSQKKPVVYAAEDSTESPEDIKQVSQNKWGVKLTETVKTTNQYAEVPLKSVSSQQWNIRSKALQDEQKFDHIQSSSESANRLRLALISKSEEKLDESYIVRPQRSGEKSAVEEKFALYSSEIEENAGEANIGDEYYESCDLDDADEIDAWRRIVGKAKPLSANELQTGPAELQQVESVFIRPEAPVPKFADVKSVKTVKDRQNECGFYLQKSSFSTCVYFMSPTTIDNDSRSSGLSENKFAAMAFDIGENNDSDKGISLTSSELTLPAFPLSAIDHMNEASEQDDDLEDLTMESDTDMDFFNDNKITQNVPKEKLLENLKEFYETKSKNLTLDMSKLSIDELLLLSNEKKFEDDLRESKRLLQLRPLHADQFTNDDLLFSSKDNAKDEGEERDAEYTIDGDVVKVDGDPYPYSKNHFEKWRMPKIKEFNMHIDSERYKKQ